MPVKEIAQVGAAIGREFSYELIAAVSPIPKAQLDDALAQLTDSGLAFRRGTPPDSNYTFKHALVQDAAYDSLLKTRRQELHGKIARVIEERFPAVRENEPEVLAHHLTAAGATQAAIPLWQKAGELAFAGMALPEAISHLNKGLELIDTLPASDERDRLELEVRAILGTAYMALLGWPAAEVEDTLKPAHELCKKAGKSAHLLTVVFGLWLYHVCQCRFEESLQLIEEMISVGRSNDDSDLEITGLMAACLTYVWMGDYAQAAQYRDGVIGLYDVDRHSHLVTRTNHDPKTGVLGWDTQLQWIQGYPDRALVSAQEMLALSRQLGSPFDLTFALTIGCAFHGMRCEPEALVERADEGIAIATETGIAFVEQVNGPMWRASALVQLGELDRCIAEMEPAIAAWADLGGKLCTPHFKSAHANALCLAGRVDEALVVINEAQELAETTGHRTYLAEVYRIKGYVLLQRDAQHGNGEEYFLKAIDVARSQAAKSWELRAATSLARLWQSLGRATEAHDLLAPVHDWFTEGFDTKDLIDARSLLDELES
jgi:predicted ATPase